MLEITQIDAFTSNAFAGNPAAVCLLDGPREDRFLQALALEMNLSETAFLLPRDDGFQLRWFTPAIEVDLCGHATLASAHFLFERGLVGPEEAARFHTRSGLLTCRREGTRIAMDFPSRAGEPCEPPAGMLESLGIGAAQMFRSRNLYMAVVAEQSEVQTLAPDFAALAAAETRGVIVTAPADDPELDFVSRFFAPAAGIPEDPVTGSAHCVSGPYWAERLGKRELSAAQLSARGGRLQLRLGPERVTLLGEAVTVMRGQWLGPDR